MLVADAVRALVQAGVAVLLLSGTAEIWHLAVAGFVSGAASAFFIPASTGLVPDTVSAPRLQQANATMALARNVAESALALRWRPARPLVTVYAFLFLATLQLLALVPPLPTPLVAAASVCAYVAIGFSGTVWETAMQQHVPRAALSRVSAYDWMISLVFRPAASALVGPAVALTGTDPVLVGGAALPAAAAGGALCVASVRHLRAA
jgi:hypothetical protein